MSTIELVSLIFTVVGAAVGATWAIRAKLSDLEKAFAVHIAQEHLERTQLIERVAKLEEPRTRLISIRQ